MKIKFLSILAVLALVCPLLVACATPPAALDEPVQVEVVNAYEFTGPSSAVERGGLLCSTEDGPCVESWNGSDIVVYSDTGTTEKFSVDGATGNVVLAGSLSVTGGITGTNVLTTGNQTIAGVKTFSTAIAVNAVTGPLTITGPTAVATATPAAIVNNLGAANTSFEVRDSATPVFVVGQAGVWTASGVGTLAGYTSSASANVTAPTAVATATPAFMVDSSGAGNVLLEVRDSATPVFRVLNGGAVNSLAALLVKDADYSVTVADSGSTIKASGAITLTLPGAAAGLQYCIVNFTGDDQVIDFADATDVALNEVNSPGDRVTNTTVYDSICLAAIDTTNWVTLSSVGTWSDGN